MSPSTLAIIILLFGSLCYWILRASSLRPKQYKNGGKLPPGPPALPIIGNLHMLGMLPHQTLAHLAKKYGSIMFLKLGSIPTIVVSSPDAAELFLKTHDLVFASRPRIEASKYLSYGGKGLGFADYGPYWRNVRKLCTLHLLSASKTESFAPIRKEELGFLVESLKKAAASHEAVDLTEVVFGLIEDMIYRIVLGRRKDDKSNLKELIQKAMNLGGAFNLSDFLPFLAPLDLQGLARSMKTLSKAIDELLEKIIDEHEQKINIHGQRNQHKDFVDVLLSLQNEPMNPHQDDEDQSCLIDRTHIKAILLDMIAASMETSATSIDWTMTELIKNPQVMQNLQEELKSIVGLNRKVEESDLGKLNYLNLVLMESFRLHPIAPLLLPHESMDDSTVNGYYIPKKSRILVNIWATRLDLELWSENAEKFVPERFIGSSMDFRGRDLRFIPFGTGRRGCPGMHFGLTTVRLTVAQLVHCFDWELPGMLPHELDMTEKFGLTLPRANHLLAKPTNRLLD